MTVEHFQCCLSLRMALGLRDLRLHDQAGTVFHQRVAHEAKDGPGAGRHLVETRLGVGHRGMRRVRPFLPAEVGFGILVAAGLAGHRLDLGVAGFGGGGGGGSSGPSARSGGAASAFG